MARLARVIYLCLRTVLTGSWATSALPDQRGRECVLRMGLGRQRPRCLRKLCFLFLEPTGSQRYGRLEASATAIGNALCAWGKGSWQRGRSQPEAFFCMN